MASSITVKDPRKKSTTNRIVGQLKLLDSGVIGQYLPDASQSFGQGGGKVYIYKRRIKGDMLWLEQGQGGEVEDGKSKLVQHRNGLVD